ncbi:helix-turn-helix domain-containing protein [Actinoplanes sp. NPDC051470]|uniref:winged helix-turn-helix transcriptional regulator n=1 Tax=Actinoplanes sp. NPDC051470 TaxID=3157224 RepID=UPI003438B41D
MRRTSFAGSECPIAGSLELVGEWWSMLILRDAFDGHTRFDAFQRNLGIAPTMLTRRLRALVSAGLLAKRQYQDRPPRHEYVLTDLGRDFRPVILALYAWGDRHLTSAGRNRVLINRATGAEITPVLVDSSTGRPVAELDAVFTAGPGTWEPA